VPQIDGGGHEKGLRSGTLNVPGIAGFGKACEICRGEMEREGARLAKLRDRLEKEMKKMDGVRVNGDLQNRLPHVSHLSFSQVDAEALLMDLHKEIAVSTGSACSSATLEPSHVLKAMGLDDEAARGSLRFSLGRFTTEEEIDYVVERVKRSLSGLLEWSRAAR
jgi:cysteine desulfurase